MALSPFGVVAIVSPVLVKYAPVRNLEIARPPFLLTLPGTIFNTGLISFEAATAPPNEPITAGATIEAAVTATICSGFSSTPFNIPIITFFWTPCNFFKKLLSLCFKNLNFSSIIKAGLNEIFSATLSFDQPFFSAS